MKNIKPALLAVMLILGLSTIAMAQPQERQGKDRQGGGQQFNAQFMNMFPVMAALDANKDGAISAEEIAGASAALKKLDANGDGVLTSEEILPQRFQGGRGGGKGGAGKGGGGRGGKGGAGGKGRDRGGKQRGGEGGAKRTRRPAADDGS